MSQPNPFARPELQPPLRHWDRRVKVKVLFFTVITIHVVVLLGVLLIQGSRHSALSLAGSEMQPQSPNTENSNHPLP